MKKYKTRSCLFLAAVLLILLNRTTYAQKNKGIEFEKSLSWTQIKSKAKAENKFIFMDVFATWCTPCKEMDQNIYVNEELGSYMNDRFISVKVQIDSAKNDSEVIKNWYAEVKKILIEYKVSAYPSFLFFSPEGKLVHRGLGFKSEKQFRSLAEEALKPDKQYYSMLDEYKNGFKNYVTMPNMVKIADDLNDQKLALEISTDYVKNYLYKLIDEALFTKDNLSLLGRHLNLLNDSDRLFQLILQKPELADKVMDSKDYSQQVISIIIRRDEIYKKLWRPGGEFITYKSDPDWVKMYNSIKTKYGEKYTKLIPPAQLLFYERAQNWKEYVKYVDSFIKNNPPKKDGNEFLELVGKPRGGDFDNWGLNYVSWNLFLNCSDPILLKEALNWSNLSIKLAWCDLSSSQLSDPISSNLHQYLDTKANLLYKLGMTKDAIACEEKAIDIMLKTVGEESDLGKVYINSYQDIIEKIKKMQPTWPVKKPI